MAATSRSASRLMVRAVTCGRPIQGGSNSGRNVTISSTRRVRSGPPSDRSTSRLVGSVQCASSKIISTGSCRASASIVRNERLQCSLPALLRGQIERGIASIVRERQHLGKERRVLDRGRGLREHAHRACRASLLRGVVVRHSGGTFHLADDRIKRAVGVLRRAEIAQPRVRLAGEAFQKRGRQPRFADAGLAGKQHHLAFAGLCSRPAPKQQFDSSSRPTRAVRPLACSASNRLSTELAAAPPRPAPARRCP